MKVKGKLKPLRDNVFVTDINFDEEVTESGIVVVGKGVRVSA